MMEAPDAWWEGATETRVLIARDPCTTGNNVGKFLSLMHPKTGNTMCYLYSDEVLQELNLFKQSYGSWFLGNYVCEDGCLYIATPIDPVFILLPIFEEARMKKGNDPGKFRQIDEIIFVPGFPAYESLSSLADKTMQVVCDLKEVGSTKFFRLNDMKVLKWLCYKVHQLKITLPTLDKNYAGRDEKDTLFDAVSIMGEYLKDDPWVNILCDKLKLNLQERIKTQNIEIQSASIQSSAVNHALEKNGVDKKTAKNSRQTKKAKVEKDSQNIKDMFFRATRSKDSLSLSNVVKLD